MKNTLDSIRQSAFSLAVAVTALSFGHGSTSAEDFRAAAVERVAEDIRYFASDELQGRGVDTDGIHLAAERILKEYRKYGLKPGMPDGTFKQPFEVSLGKVDVTTDTAVVLTDPNGSSQRLEVGREFQPLRRGLNGRGAGGIVFVGYGISSEEDGYDDYANIDVEGKVIVMIRREPQQGKVDGAFAGTETSKHAFIDQKLKLAKKHKAAGILFVNDPYTVTSSGQDELSSPTGFGTTDAGVPFAHVKNSVIDRLLAASPLKPRNGGEIQTLTSLSQATDFIDRTLQPISQELKGWSAEVNTRFDSQSVTAYNLIGVLEGEGPLADETIIMGAHYDHLGFGGYGSRARDRKGEIHNGADDNASGTAALLEVIRRVADGPKFGRRIVFICFSGEERGLLGSSYYVKNPVFPLEKTITMLNYDMIGTLRNEKVEVSGVKSAVEFRDIVDAADAASPLSTKIVDSPFGGSDHLPFYRRDIPVMFYFTGVTDRYHTPDDDYETVNVTGVVSIVDFSVDVLNRIIELPKPPEFQSVKRGGGTTRKVPFLGVVPNLGADKDEDGVPIQGVRPDSPAQQAGIQTGDTIIQANATRITGYSDLIAFMRASKTGDKVDISVRRGSEIVKLNATLAKPR